MFIDENEDQEADFIIEKKFEARISITTEEIINCLLDFEGERQADFFNAFFKALHKYCDNDRDTTNCHIFDIAESLDENGKRCIKEMYTDIHNLAKERKENAKREEKRKLKEKNQQQAIKIKEPYSPDTAYKHDPPQWKP